MCMGCIPSVHDCWMSVMDLVEEHKISRLQTMQALWQAMDQCLLPDWHQQMAMGDFDCAIQHWFPSGLADYILC